MKRVIRIAAVALLVVVAVAVGYGAWWLLVNGRAPATRYDLVLVPAQVPPPAKGYPTRNALYLAYMAGWIEIADLKAEHPAPEGVTVERDLGYASGDGRELKLDLYRPTKLPADSRPILLFIHGGGWSGGDKRDYEIYCNKFSGLGYVVASMEYRFAPKSTFPAALLDTNTAIRWLKNNAWKYGGDPNRVAVIGGSAGGYLALMAAYSSHVSQFRGSGDLGVSSRVQAVVDLYGPVDLAAPEAQTAPEVTRFIGREYARYPDTYRLASPLSYVDPTDPPTLIIHGTLDDIVPVHQSDRLAEALKKAGVDYWYDRIDGWPHTLDLATENFEHTSAVIHEFLKAHGLGAE